MSKTTITSKSQQKAIRFEFDMIAWLRYCGADSRGVATVAKEKLRASMNADIASGLYVPPKKKKASNARKV